MTQKRSAQAQKKQFKVCQENERLLSIFYSFKKEFNNEFKKRVGTPKAKEFYFHVLTKLNEGVLANETSNLSKLLSLVDCISTSDPKIHTYLHESEYPLNNTNLVILACKYNRPEILKCLLNCGEKILNILSSSEPEFIDDEKHNAFYYAICSGNVDLLDTLVNEWPNKYFASNPEKLDKVLAKAYRELKLKNILLSKQIESFVESKLLDLRFYSNSSSQVKFSQYNLNSIEDRIQLVTENIDFLRTNYSDEEKVDDKFLFVATFITQNIHVLKRQLKSTYDRLPWEEIEFCLICFVSSYIKQQEINLFFKWTLNKGKILKYLEDFAKKLINEVGFINCSIDELTELPNLPREQVVAEILRQSPQLKELYSDYEKLRDVFSLEKISAYLKLALSANPQEREGQLIITRVIQVIGEHLKNTLGSPKLSQSTSEGLLLSLPSEARKFFNEIRNALSHSYALSKRIEFEDDVNLHFFSGMQNDMKKINLLVTDIIHRNKMKNITTIFESILEVKNPEEIKNFSEIFNSMPLNENNSENVDLQVHERLEKAIKMFHDTITDQTDNEKELFKQINDIIDSTRILSKGIKNKYEFGLIQLKYIVTFLISGRSDKNSVGDLKLLVDATTKYITPDIELHKLKKIVELSIKILHTARLRQYGEALDKLHCLSQEIFWIAEFGNDLTWIEKLREELTGKTLIPIQKQKNLNKIPRNKYKNKLEVKQRELQTVMSNNGFSSPATENLAIYRKSKNLQLIVEMLVLDIMSILETSKNILEDNHFFLDEDFPVLTGKCLRNHLAHGNALIDLLPLDSVTAVVLNAQKLIKIDNKLTNYKKVDKLVPVCSALRAKFNQDLLIIKNQDLMFSALSKGDLSSFKNCLRNGADIYARSFNLQTSPHFASMAPNLDVVKFIHGLDINFDVQDIADKTPLHIAAELGTQCMVEFLIEKAGLSIEGVDNAGKTPLHYAAKNGHKEVLRTLLKNGASTVTQDICDYTPIHYAIAHNHINVVKILVEEDRDFDINEVIGGHSPLCVAAEYGHLKLVEFLLQKKANVNVKNGRNRIALHEAARNGHVEVVNVLIKNGVDINAPVEDDCTALHFSVENGHEQVVFTLLQYGAKVNIKEKMSGSTPLNMAAKNGHQKIVTILLKNKANPNESSFNGATSLLIAANEGRLEIVADLLKYGADVHAGDENSLTSLHCAAKYGCRHISKLLIHHGANVDARAIDGSTPLHSAAEKGHKDVVEFLIISKADINAASISGDTPLHLAAIKGSIDVVDILIKNKAEINAKNNRGVTPLFLAAKAGHKTVVTFLIKNKAEVNPESADGYTPLFGAILDGHKDVTEVLIENGARINILGKSLTLLSLAVEGGFKEIVELLLAKGADANIRINNNMPLLSAVTLNQKEIVEVLLRNGADPNGDGGKPIIQAVHAGFKEIVEILLAHKARTDFKHPDNSTLLHSAVSRGHKNIVKILINEEMDVNALTVNNKTPLFYACLEGHEDIVKVLTENKANVNVRCAGAAPLHAAARFGHDRVVKILLHNGAKINNKDRENKTPLEIAVMYGHLEVVKILLQCNVEIINKPVSNGLALLHVASQENGIEVVKYLVKEGSNVNAKTASGLKPVHIAAGKGGKDIVEFFISNGVSINDVDSNERTILHHAALTGFSDVVKYLLANGAAINSKDLYGRTPMHLAACFGSKAVVKLLLQYGAFYNIVDKLNKKPLHVSEDRSVSNLLELTEKLFDAVKRKSPEEVQNYLKEGAFVDAKTADYGTPLHYAAREGYVEVMNILLENGANPNSVCKGGFTPLHYAAEYSHLKAALALLDSGAVYNAVSDTGKTPLDFASNKRVDSLLRLVNVSFKKVQNGDSRIINDLNRLNDIETVRAIMNASNKETHSLIVAAMHCKFPESGALELVFQDNIADELSRASNFFERGDYQVSLSILTSLFDKRKKIFGLNNPAVINIEEEIVKVLLKQGKYQESLNILDNILQKLTKMLGTYHQCTLRAKSTIASVFLKQGKNEQALSIFNEVYPKQKETLGPHHPDTLVTQVYVALVMDRLQKCEEALILIQIAYEKLKSILGENDVRTMLAQENLGLILSSQKKYKEALKIYENNLEKMNIVFGLNHPETVVDLHNIASILCDQRKYRDALNTYQKVLDIQRNYLGSMHPETLVTQYHMALVYTQQGKRMEVLKIYRDIYFPVKVVLGQEDPVFLNMSQSIEELNLACELERGFSSLEFFQHLQKDINIAVCKGDIKAVEFLIKNGSPINDRDADGRSPLHYAINKGHTDVVNVLLKRGADPTQITNKGNTPLHTAVSVGRKEIIEILLKHVSPDKLSNFLDIGTLASETTSLHVAAKNGSLEIVKSLLKYGATYNITNKEGKTPVEVSQDKNVSSFLKITDELFKATAKGSLEVIPKLKALKFDEFAAATRARNNQRSTLLQVASINKHREIAIQLLQLLKKANQNSIA